MLPANQTIAHNEAPPANGQSQLNDLFALTDEQILEIEPEAQDVTVREAQNAQSGGGEANVSTATGKKSNEQDVPVKAGTATATQQSAQADAGRAAGTEPPEWLAQRMKDPWNGEEARELWNGVQHARQEAAAYREVFARPEEARSASERARVLDDIDRAYFAGDANERSRLAAMMLREDPAAFREMVVAGLRALEDAGKSSSGTAATADTSRLAKALGADRNYPSAEHGSPTAGAGAAGQGQTGNNASEAFTSRYAAFEKAANEDLERSVGGVIERTLEQALPATGRTEGAALKGRIGATIRQDIEKALQSDRQLGEQVAQILSARTLDDTTRAQVVRLIGERAQQLVPVAAKRALNEWTQTTFAAHQARNSRSDAASTRHEVAPASSAAGLPRGNTNQNRPDSGRGATGSRSVDYRKLSDEQILNL